MRNQRIREWQKLENTLGLFKPKTFILQKGKYRPRELTKLSKVISLMVGEELGLEDLWFLILGSFHSFPHYRV